jgi:hypothetical protein
LSFEVLELKVARAIIATHATALQGRMSCPSNVAAFLTAQFISTILSVFLSSTRNQFTPSHVLPGFSNSMNYFHAIHYIADFEFCRSSHNTAFAK